MYAIVGNLRITGGGVQSQLPPPPPPLPPSTASEAKPWLCCAAEQCFVAADKCSPRPGLPRNCMKLCSCGRSLPDAAAKHCPSHKRCVPGLLLDLGRVFRVLVGVLVQVLMEDYQGFRTNWRKLGFRAVACKTSSICISSACALELLDCCVQGSIVVRCLPYSLNPKP